MAKCKACGAPIIWIPKYLDWMISYKYKPGQERGEAID